MDVEQAANRALPYQVYDTGSGEPSAGVVGFDNRSWMRSAATEPIPANVMVNVGSASGMAVFAPAWAGPPYTRLYIQSARGHWHPLIPVP